MNTAFCRSTPAGDFLKFKAKVVARASVIIQAPPIIWAGKELAVRRILLTFIKYHGIKDFHGQIYPWPDNYAKYTPERDFNSQM